jgi:hypothetical protein
MSSGTVVDEMVVKLNGDNSDFVKMWKDSIGQVQSAVSAIKATIAGWGLYSLVNKAVNAFAEAEDVAIKLNATLKANGRDVEKVGEDYAKFANTMQSLTRVDDDAVAGLLQVAETMGITGEAAKRAAQNAIGLAAARGISAQAAIRMTVALEQGTTTMLTRQFPALRKVKNESERLALAHKLVGNTFEVAKASAGGMAGQYDQLSNAIGNVWEDFGEVAVKFVKPVVSWVKDVATAFRDMLPVIKESADWFINKYQDVWKSFKLGFAVVFGLFYNFKENTAVLSAWWVENWQKALQVFGNVLVKGTSATINNLWVLLEFFVSEAVIWFGQSGYDMAVSWGTALETTMAEQAAKAYSSALRQLGRTDEAFNVMSNFYTERAQKEKAADAKAADTKKQREKEYETRRKAAGGRLVSITSDQP